MSNLSTDRNTGRPRWRRIFIWLAAGLPALLVAAGLALQAWLGAYLRGEEFRQLVSQRIGQALHAEARFSPIKFSGMRAYSEDLLAHGSEKAAFSRLRIDQVRAELSLRRWRERVWQIDHLDAQRVALELDGSRVTLPERPAPARKTARSPAAGWLPNRVEVGSATVRDFSLQWGKARGKPGELRGTALNLTPQEGGWMIQGQGGQLVHGTLPALDVAGCRALYRPGGLFVQEAELRLAPSGTIRLDGEARFDDHLDLRARLAGISVTPLLHEDWRLRLRGNLNGEVRVQSRLPSKDAPVLSGALALSEGHLEALPMLDQIAVFTRLQQYRRVALSKASASFRHEAGGLRVTDLIAESDGLMRVEGAFNVAGGLIDGAFQVGVTPASLKWLPGSQARVFTEARAGYVWAPMRLSGPVAKPAEDLSPRLVAAAQGAVIEKVESTLRDATQTGRDVIKGTLDWLLPPGK